MRKSLLTVLAIVFLTLGCSKERVVSNKLIGTWQLSQYKLTFLNGISEFAFCEGELNVSTSDLTEWNNSFELNTTYEFPSLSGSTVENGYYRIKQKGDFLDASYRDSANLETQLLDYRIMVLNRTDLQVEFRDTSGMINHLTFRRVN